MRGFRREVDSVLDDLRLHSIISVGLVSELRGFSTMCTPCYNVGTKITDYWFKWEWADLTLVVLLCDGLIKLYRVRPLLRHVSCDELMDAELMDAKCRVVAELNNKGGPDFCCDLGDPGLSDRLREFVNRG